MTLRTLHNAVALDGLGAVVQRATAALPATTDVALFTVTGRVILLSIVGEVTTIIQAQANATKLKVNPTVGADVDLCATLDINGDAVGTLYTITGTPAHAMQRQASGFVPCMTQSLILADGAIELDCAATNTGSVKWTVNYIPLDEGSRIVAA